MMDSPTAIPNGVPMAIALRAYASKAEVAAPPSKQLRKFKRPSPSEWVLVVDTETTTDAAQALRFGTYQVYKSGELKESGLFYAPDTLLDEEQATLRAYAGQHGLVVKTRADFVEEVFYKVGYHYRGTIVGFNLPFDISRLAIKHNTARPSPHNKIMQGGFTFQLSEDPYRPRVQIKHRSARDAFIQFAAPIGQRATKGKRKKGDYQPVRRGYFVDAKTLAAALTSQSHSLDSLAKALGVEAQKHQTEEHGQTLTADYIAYAVQDTQATWECYGKLQELYQLHGLKQSQAHNIHSEASLGKAYLQEMGVQPWRPMQADFPPAMLGIIMSTYYGGRSEVHIRKTAVQILYCDFMSMYPTVCTLMGLWRFVTAENMTWQDSTEKTRKMLENINLAEIQNPEIWANLCTLVQVKPEKDIFPVRAKYNGEAQYTIGANYLTNPTPQWFTLADCIASKMLTGRAPQVLQAITFMHGQQQQNLKPIRIAGNAAYTVDPAGEDFFKRVIDLRREVKEQMKTASPAKREALDNQQLALKILANATSYGIFVELNVERENVAQPMICYGRNGEAIPLNMKKVETAGKFFHPLLGSLITGAARLMLATAEHLAAVEGLDWAFCDTDSMALAKPDEMEQEEFYARAKRVQEWFTPLSPYAGKPALFKVEDHNYSRAGGKTLAPLYCYAISSKRYALFNLVDGKPILRKVSAHGLGHLIPPYQKDSTGYLKDSKPWQQDLWLKIVEAGLAGKHPDYASLQNFNLPAVSRYAATTPELLKWFQSFNADKPENQQMRPFNFLLAMQAHQQVNTPKPVATYHKDPTQAVCFDRETGKSVPRDGLKTYLEALAQYHLHPESKFLNANYCDRGITQRRHIIVNGIHHIGKEADKWEEQYFMGLNSDAQLEYGSCPKLREEQLEAVLRGIETHGAEKMARQAKLSGEGVRKIQNGKATPTSKTLTKLAMAAMALDGQRQAEEAQREKIKATMQERGISLRALADELGVDASNLSKMISGQRPTNFRIFSMLQRDN